MDQRRDNLLDEALRLDSERSRHGKIVVIEDCVEISGAFLLHHFTKRSLSSSTSAILIFVAFSHPFSHYDRILRKMGCNLAMHREKSRLFFLDMYMPEFPCEDGLIGLYGRVHEVVMNVEATGNPITILVDDISLMEVAAHKCRNDVLIFMHYCRALALDYGCMFVVLCHGDIHVDMETPGLLMWVLNCSHVVLRVGQLATGSSNHVHGQVGIWRKGLWDGVDDEVHNLHFMVKETCASFFSPGTLHSGQT